MITLKNLLFGGKDDIVTAKDLADKYAQYRLFCSQQDEEEPKRSALDDSDYDDDDDFFFSDFN